MAKEVGELRKRRFIRNMTERDWLDLGHLALELGKSAEGLAGELLTQAVRTASRDFKAGKLKRGHKQP
jgi:hypothetical protein